MLRISLGGSGSFDSAPSVEEWETLFAEARKHSVTAFLSRALEILPEEQLPPLSLSSRWMMERGRTSSRGALADKRAAELTAIFREGGLKCCVLKGQGNARYYPDPSSRTSGDIDLWVPGPREKTLAFLEGKYHVGSQVYIHADVDFFDDMPVEVHFHPSFFFNMVRNARLQEWFEAEAEKWEVEECAGFYRPNVLFAAVYSLSHILKHIINEGVGLRQVLDHHFIMAALPPERKEEFRKVATEFGLSRVAAALAYVEQEVFADLASDCVFAPDPVRGPKLLDDICRSGNFSHYATEGGGRISRLLRFLPDYPSEVLWLPVRQAWEWSWRLLKGYAKFSDLKK